MYKTCKTLLLFMFLAGCGTTAPYTVSVHDFRDNADPGRVAWFAETTVVLTVHNNTNTAATLQVECTDVAPWCVTVPAHGKKRVFVSLMNQDVHSNPCTVTYVGSCRK